MQPHQPHPEQRQRQVLLPRDGEEEAGHERPAGAALDRPGAALRDEALTEEPGADEERDGHAVGVEALLHHPLHGGLGQPHDAHEQGQPRVVQLVLGQEVERDGGAGHRRREEHVPGVGPRAEPHEGRQQQEGDGGVVARQRDAAHRVELSAVGQLPQELVVDALVEVERAEPVVAQHDEATHGDGPGDGQHHQDPERDPTVDADRPDDLGQAPIVRRGCGLGADL